jgi:hypothetical protein
MSYGGANAFFNKTFVVTFDLGPNYQLIAGDSNVESRFYVSSDGEVSFYPASTERTGCSGSGGPTTKVNQIRTTSHICDEVFVATTSSVNIDGDILTYTETRLVTSSASRNKSRTQRAYSFRFDGRTCEDLRYIVEGILMSPVSCRVEDGNTTG